MGGMMPFQLAIPAAKGVAPAKPNQGEYLARSVTNLLAGNQSPPTPMEEWRLWGIWLPVNVVMTTALALPEGMQLQANVVASLIYGGDLIWTAQAQGQSIVGGTATLSVAQLSFRDNLQNPIPVRRGRQLELEVSAGWSYSGAGAKPTVEALETQVAQTAATGGRNASISYDSLALSGHRTL